MVALARQRPINLPPGEGGFKDDGHGGFEDGRGTAKCTKLAGSYGKQRRFDTLEHLFLVHSVANCIAIPLPTSLRSATFPSGEGMAAYAAKR